MVAEREVRSSLACCAAIAVHAQGSAARTPPSRRSTLPVGNRKGGKSAPRRPREFVLRTISHNVRSLRQPEAIEVIIASMQANHVEAYCMQETWLGGSEVKTNKGYTIVLVNEPDAKRRGVGIILSKAATKAWDAAGRRQCTP